VFPNVKSNRKQRLSKRAGYTFIELLAVIFIIALATGAYGSVPKSHGMGVRIAAAFIGGAVGFGIVALFYRWSWRRNKARLKKLRADYVGIYKVLVVPGDDQPGIMLEGTEIWVGDHGWEAAPLVKNGLVYLQGLTPDWRTVWHAGFRPDQIERMGLKPSSQYDHWVPYWAKAPRDACPFPIQPRETPSMDRPHHSR
jgi:prepilin-type N-terminal cleavage/methylation domain-containing protein